MERDPDFKYAWKLRSWIDQDKLDWAWLSSNPCAIRLLEENPDKIYCLLYLKILVLFIY